MAIGRAQAISFLKRKVSSVDRRTRPRIAVLEEMMVPLREILLRKVMKSKSKASGKTPETLTATTGRSPKNSMTNPKKLSLDVFVKRRNMMDMW